MWGPPPSPSKPVAYGKRRDQVAWTACVLAAIGAVVLCYSTVKHQLGGYSLDLKLVGGGSGRPVKWVSMDAATESEAAPQRALAVTVAIGQQAEAGLDGGPHSAAAKALQESEAEQARHQEAAAAQMQELRDAEAAAAAAAAIEADEAHQEERQRAASGKEEEVQEEKQQEEKQQEEGGEEQSKVFRKLMRGCWHKQDLDCWHAQKDVVPGPGQFRFPHFFIIGFQKCATTSLYHHLAEHPQLQHPREKEPEFFTHECGYNAFRCPRAKMREWLDNMRLDRIAKDDFEVGGFEGSTHYALEGRWLAPQLRDLFPWLRLIISMRDPISQAISMVNHNMDRGRSPPCWERGDGTVFNCGLEYLDDESRYATSLRHWIRHFPLEQLKIIQYENLTSPGFMAPALRDIKAFLEVEPSQPSDSLGLYNSRHQTQENPGWPIKRHEYKQLVEKARRNAQEVVEIVRQYGFADADAWMANWEAAWQDNLDSNCGPGDNDRCSILVT